jgi:hypothetical protein
VIGYIMNDDYVFITWEKRFPDEWDLVVLG